MQPSKKNVAHFILSQLLKDSIKEFGSPYLINTDGSFTIYRKGKPYTFSESKVSIRYILDNSNYSLKQITDAANLLAAKNQIIIAGVPDEAKIEEAVIKVTPAGILAYEERDYKTINYEKWTFWLVAVIGTAIALTALLLLIYRK